MSLLSSSGVANAVLEFVLLTDLAENDGKQLRNQFDTVCISAYGYPLQSLGTPFRQGSRFCCLPGRDRTSARKQLQRKVQEQKSAYEVVQDIF
jgi:hypothetical protein